MSFQHTFLQSVFTAARLRCRFAAVVALFSLLSILTQSSPAQTTSTVEGAVRDKQGLAISGAHVRAVSAELGIDSQRYIRTRWHLPHHSPSSGSL